MISSQEYLQSIKTGLFISGLISYGNYIELSIDGFVKLTLMDYTFAGNYIGLYSASSVISLQKLQSNGIAESSRRICQSGRNSKTVRIRMNFPFFGTVPYIHPVLLA